VSQSEAPVGSCLDDFLLLPVQMQSVLQHAVRRIFVPTQTASSERKDSRYCVNATTLQNGSRSYGSAAALQSGAMSALTMPPYCVADLPSL
jgi:hypothetical protein